MVSRKNRKKTLKKRKSRTRRQKYKMGGNNDKVICSMCEKSVDKENTLTPSICVRQNLNKSHRICSKCWWDKTSGFAIENNTNHKCPGCAKKIPLTKTKYETSEIVDLTK